MSRHPSPGPSSNSHHRDHIIPINNVQQPLQDQHQPHSALHVPSGIPHHLPPPPSQQPATFLMASGNGTSRAGSRKGYSSAITATAEDVKYQAKYRELKRKVRDIEADNDKLLFKVMQARRNIQRAKLERAILYERLAALPPTPPPNHTGLPPVPAHGHLDAHGVPPPGLPPQAAPPAHHSSHRHRESHRERHEQRHHDAAPYPPPGSTPHQQHQSPPRQNVVQVETDQGPALVLAGPDGRPLVNENGHVMPANSAAILPPPPSSGHSHGQGHSRRRERRDRERERDREERYERDREVHGHASHHSQHELGHPSHLEPPPLSEESRSRSRSAADAPAQYHAAPLSPPLPAERVHHDIPAHAQAPTMHGGHRERPSRSQRERERQREWERERELRQQELLREHEAHPHAGGYAAAYPDVLPAQPGAPPAQAQLQERDREIRERERGRERAERERERAARRHDLPEIAPAATASQQSPLPPPGSAEMAHAHISPQNSPEAAHREARSSGRAGHASSYHSHHGHGHSHSHSRSHSTSPTSPMGPRYTGRIHNHQRMGPGTNFNRGFDVEQREGERDADTTRPSSSRIPTPPYIRQGEGSAHMDVEDRDVDMSGGRSHPMDMDNSRDRDMSENDNVGAAGTRSVSSLSDEP